MTEGKTPKIRSTASAQKGAFTIINRTREINVKRAEFEVNLRQGLKRTSPKTADIFEKLPQPLREAALSSTAPRAPLDWVRSPRKPIPEQQKLLSQFATAVKIAGTRAEATTVGILDLGARISDLTKLIDRMNMAQDRMVFLEVQTPVPAGLIKTGAALLREFRNVLGEAIFNDNDSQDVGRNMLVNEFLTFGEAVRQKNGLDKLIGITPAMLAYYRNEKAFYNYFSYGDGSPVSMVSTFDLRDYATKAKRPFEAAVGMLLVGRMISDRNHLNFHKDSRGCPLDHNADRDGLVESIRAMRFDTQCLQAIETQNESEADAARKLMSALKRMRGGTK